MDRRLRPSRVSALAFYDGRDRVQDEHQFTAALVSVIVSVCGAGLMPHGQVGSDDGVHDGPLGARSQQEFTAYGLRSC